MKSIQRQLTLKVLAATVALCVASGAALYFIVRSALLKQQDRTLLTEAHAISGLVHRLSNGQLELDFSPSNLPEFQAVRPTGFFVITRADGTVIARSASMESNRQPAASVSHEPSYRNVILPNGNAGRAVNIQFAPDLDEDESVPATQTGNVKLRPGELLGLYLSRDTTHIDQTLAIIFTAIGITVLAFALATALVVTLTVRRGLRPLHRLSKSVGEIDVSSLDQQLLLDDLPTELRPVAQRTNQLLVRLASAFARERRFTADVAHELRTPVAELRTLAEVAVKWPEEAQSSQRFQEVLDIARQMERLIVTLLSLARCTSARIVVQLTALNLCAVVRKTWSSVEPEAGARRLEGEVGHA